MGSLQGVRMSSRVETMIRSRPCSSTSIRLWNREGGGEGKDSTICNFLVICRYLLLRN